MRKNEKYVNRQRQPYILFCIAYLVFLIACDKEGPIAVRTATQNDEPVTLDGNMDGVGTIDRPPELEIKDADNELLQMTAIDHKMVLIDAGLFAMGSEKGGAEEKPVHLVELEEYYIDLYEVTLGQYRVCVEAGGCLEPIEAPGCVWYRLADEMEPINCMTWYDANSYCTWAKLRLPSEAEWEKAARGVDGRTYPWGEDVDRTKANYKGGFGRAIEVGSYPDGRSPYGLYDMGGNVWEWVEDRYDENYYVKSPYKNPLGPERGVNRVLRGGSWCFISNAMRSTRRVPYYVGTTDTDIGFRCAANVE